MALVKAGDRFWIAKTRAEVETQFGNADEFPRDSVLRIISGSDAGDYYWSPTSTATPGPGTISVSGESGRFLLGASSTVTPPATSTVAGTAAAFPAGTSRIFHSDGTTAGGIWTQLSEADVTASFAAGAIASSVLKPGTNGHILTTSGGVATWAAPALVSDAVNGGSLAFPSGVRRIFHSDGTTAGGTWAQLTSTDVTAAFADSSIPPAKISLGGGTEGQVIKIVSGVPAFADESGTGASPVTGSVSGTVNAFTPSVRRIFHSDGTTAGGTWAQLTSTDVTAAFAAGAIGAGIITAGSAGQVLTTSGGVATWAAPAAVATVTSSVAGTVNAFTPSVRRIFHSDGTTAGGTWAQLTSTDVTAAFAAGAIGAGIITAGSAGQVLTTSGGVATWAAPAAVATVTSSVAGTVNAFTPSVRRIFHSDGTTAGGTWAQLTSTDVTAAFAAGAIGAGIITAGSAGQVLTTSGGVATWAAPATVPFVSSAATGTAAAFPAGTSRIFHSDGTTAGGIWTQLSEADVTASFAAGAIASSVLKPGTNGHILTTSGGVATWADAVATVLGSANQGEILYRNATTWVKLPVGQVNQVLHTGGAGANPSWSHGYGATVVLRSGDSSGTPHTYASWTEAWNACVSYSGPVALLVEDTGAPITVPSGTYEGNARVGVFFANRFSGSQITLTIASGAEIRNITAWSCVSAWPFSINQVLVSVQGTSTNSTVIANTSMRGNRLLYSGSFYWLNDGGSTRTSSVLFASDCTLQLREVLHDGNLPLRAVTHARVVTENSVTITPPIATNSGTSTLTIRQRSGDRYTQSWTGSGGIVREVTDSVAALGYSPVSTGDWPEGTPTHPGDAFDKLAARNPGTRPPGASLAHNKWWTFSKNTEGLDFATNTEGTSIWVPHYNHWLHLGFASNNTETDHRSLACGSSHRGMQNLLHQGWWEFQAGSDTVSSNFKRPFSVVTVPNGSAPRVVVSAQLVSAGTQCVATSDDGGDTWTLRSGHFASSTNGYRGMAWTGTHIIGIADVSNSTVGRSTNGTTWASETVSTAQRVKVVSNGSGTVLAFTSTGAIDISTDHGDTWTTGSIAGFSGALFDAVWFNGQFIVWTATGNMYSSANGVTWSATAPIVVKHPGKSGFLPYGYTYRSIVECGGVLYGLFRGTYDSFTIANVFYSMDGATWMDSGTIWGWSVNAIDALSTRFSVHLSSTSTNVAASLQSEVHQMAGRIVDMQHADFDLARDWFISPAVVAGI